LLYLSQEEIAQGDTPIEFLGRSDQQVNGKTEINGVANFYRTIMDPAALHQYQEVHIGMLGRLTVRVRAEQSNPPRPEFLCDL
jgi:hypothetical protein